MQFFTTFSVYKPKTERLYTPQPIYNLQLRPEVFGQWHLSFSSVVQDIKSEIIKMDTIFQLKFK